MGRDKGMDTINKQKARGYNNNAKSIYKKHFENLKKPYEEMLRTPNREKMIRENLLAQATARGTELHNDRITAHREMVHRIKTEELPRLITANRDAQREYKQAIKRKEKLEKKIKDLNNRNQSLYNRKETEANKIANRKYRNAVRHIGRVYNEMVPQTTTANIGIPNRSNLGSHLMQHSRRLSPETISLINRDSYSNAVDYISKLDNRGRPLAPVYLGNNPEHIAQTYSGLVKNRDKVLNIFKQKALNDIINNHPVLRKYKTTLNNTQAELKRVNTTIDNALHKMYEAKTSKAFATTRAATPGPNKTDKRNLINNIYRDLLAENHNQLQAAAEATNAKRKIIDRIKREADAATRQEIERNKNNYERILSTRERAVEGIGDKLKNLRENDINPLLETIAKNRKLMYGGLAGAGLAGAGLAYKKYTS